ncbi:MAG: sulfurtransferase TusA family protein [Thioalkalispiraceae bacterium]|jgi:TusA-related sulfurtransferase
MWPFKKKQPEPTIHAAVSFEEDVAVIDVRGQTCPGYLLAINRAVDTLEAGTRARLLISYPPCGDDVKAWSHERNIAYLGMRQDGGQWVIEIQK